MPLVIPTSQLSLHLEQAQNPPLELRPISSNHPNILAYHQGKLLPFLLFSPSVPRFFFSFTFFILKGHEN